jgi:hypothetical protein
MSEEDIPEKKLKRLTSAKDLSTAIQKLERKKELLEDDLKDQAHYFFKHLNPISMLDLVLQNIKKSSSSKYRLFEEALAFGTGNLSKRKLIHHLKSALINTFAIHPGINSHKTKAVLPPPAIANINVNPTEFKKKVMI